MVVERLERMSLRQLLGQAEKLTREVGETALTQYQTKLNEVHDLSRPVRRKSSYPTVVSLLNSVHRLTLTSKDLLKTMALMEEFLGAIRELAQKERAARK